MKKKRHQTQNKNPELELLQKQEKLLFDTYKTKSSDKDKYLHLETMASVIRQIEKLKQLCAQRILKNT